MESWPYDQDSDEWCREGKGGGEPRAERATIREAAWWKGQMERLVHEVVALKVENMALKRDNARLCGAFQSCVEEIRAGIIPGPLPGYGCDPLAERNGLVLAQNIVARYVEQCEGRGGDGWRALAR